MRVDQRGDQVDQRIDDEQDSWANRHVGRQRVRHRREYDGPGDRDEASDEEQLRLAAGGLRLGHDDLLFDTQWCGGAARVLRITFEDANEEAHLVSELQAARDDEYGEVLDRVPAFLAKLRSERDRYRATYEEVEESEADLERFRAWLAKIDRRDYFRASRRADAHAAVERCAQALEAFESEALARDAQPAAEHPPLRAVEDTP